MNTDEQAFDAIFDLDHEAVTTAPALERYLHELLTLATQSAKDAREARELIASIQEQVGPFLTKLESNQMVKMMLGGK